jgi:hypothetical protein
MDLAHNELVKDHGTPRHPGPWRVMPTDAEIAGFIVAIGFVVMGVVGIPIIKFFLFGAVLLGGAVALLLRFSRKK